MVLVLECIIIYDVCIEALKVFVLIWKFAHVINDLIIIIGIHVY